MQGHRVLMPFLVPGTLTANIVFTFEAPFDFRFRTVSACGSNANDAELMLGISTDTNSILAAAVIGDSDVPVEKRVADFASTNATGAVSKGEIVVLTVDFDGTAGTAAADLCILFDILEG
jgi:hypothetical protein